MDKNILKDLIDQNHSQRKIAHILNISQSSVRHWINKYKLRTHTSANRKCKTDHKRCSRCKIEKRNTEFYISGGRFTRYCKKCHSERCGELHIERKMELLEYKGGKCERCKTIATNENYCIFDLHHLDPNQKEHNLRISTNGIIKLKKEADKCILLCSNCHRLEHHNLRKNDPLLSALPYT